RDVRRSPDGRSATAHHPARRLRGALSLGVEAGLERREGDSRRGRGGVPERSKGADCKSAALTRYEGSNPSPTTWRAGVAQLVEHQPCKLRVAGSSPVARLLVWSVA